MNVVFNSHFTSFSNGFPKLLEFTIYLHPSKITDRPFYDFDHSLLGFLLGIRFVFHFMDPL